MHVYCSGIGGVGIGPLAMLALDAGYKVSGSDRHESEMTQLLADRGAAVAFGQDGSQIMTAQNIQPIDWFVYSSALPDNHPELTFAKEHSIKATKRDDFINTLLSDKQLAMIAVAGTHGKTTVTGMVIWLLKQLDQPVSYSIGTSISFGPPAQYQDGSRYFIYECDEFDRNFLHYHPSLSAIVSVDYDHVDTYPTQESYNYAFTDFIGQSEYSILWQTDATKLSVPDSSSIEILSESDPGIDTIKLIGSHNRRNGWLAIHAVHQLYPEIDLNKLRSIIKDFPGTNRRFEKLADNLYTDYAHHPSEISATIQAAKELGNNVVVVYQPHQNIRQHELLKENAYEGTFAQASHVYWLPTYQSREYKDLVILSPQELIASTKNPDTIEPAEMNDQLWANIQKHLAKGDIVVAMAAGDLDTWLRDRVKTK